MAGAGRETGLHGSPVNTMCNKTYPGDQGAFLHSATRHRNIEPNLTRNLSHGQGSTTIFHRTPPTLPSTDYAEIKSPVPGWTWRWRRQEHPPESRGFPVVSRRHQFASLLGFLGQVVFGPFSNTEEASALSLWSVVQLLNNKQHSSSHWIRNHSLGVANPTHSHGPGPDGETCCQPWHPRSQVCRRCWQESENPFTSCLFSAIAKS